VRKAGLFAGVVMMAATPALSQEAAVKELVVTGSPYAVSIDSAATHVEVLRRSALETAQPAGLGDALAGVPGLRSSAYGPGASRPIIRGQTGPRVLILQNGVGLVDASSLSPDHAVAADAAGSQRIEILRGPSTLAYGGSAIGGVVNVIDDRIAQDRPDKAFSGRASTSLGGPGEAFGAAGGVAAGLGGLVLTADASGHESGDYATPGGVQRNTDVAFLSYGAGASVVGENGHVGLGIKRTETLYGVPFEPVPGGEGPVAIDLEQTRYDLRGERAFERGPFERARLSVGHADYEHREEDVASGEIHTRFLSDGTEGRVELIQRPRDGWQGAIGVQGLARDLEAIGEEAFIPASTIREAGLFVLQRRDFGGWGLEGGLRADRRSIETLASGRVAFDNLSGSAAVFWRPAEGAFLALVLARNARAPTEFELYADGPHPGTGAFELGDAALTSEAVTSVETTARWRGGRWRIEGHVFGAAYDGYIDQRPTGEQEDGLPVFRFVQTGARFVGAEAEAGVDLGRGFGLDIAADYVNASSDLGAIARMPPASVTARLTYRGARLEAYGEVRRVQGQNRLAPFETATPGHTLLEARISWRPRGDEGPAFYLEGRNLTDQTAREHVSFLKDIVVQPGRTLRAGVAAHF